VSISTRWARLVERGERWTAFTTEMPAFFFLLAVLPGAGVLGMAFQFLRWTNHRTWFAASLLVLAAGLLIVVVAIYAAWFIHARIRAAARPKR